MATKSSVSTVKAWDWVIQSLSFFKQVDPSTLAGVVKKASVVSDDLEKDTKEIVSLRILESLFIDENEAAIETHSTQNPKISFDSSERCEDVLQRILDETSEPMMELERQKWNVQPFITNKRASLPKSSLQKLKEAVLEGSHPLLASLKERSNIEGTNVHENSQNTIPKVNVDFKDQTTVSKDDMASVNPANENNKSQDSLLHKPDHLDTSSIGITECIERKEHEMPKEPLLEGLEENILMDHDEHTPSKKLQQSCDNANVDHDQQELTDNVPQDTYRKEHDKRVLTDIFTDPKNDNVPNASNTEPSDDGRKYMENTDNERSDDEMIDDIAAKKEAFLNSQYTLSQDSMATIDSTQIYVCMKCNKGGKLLVCSSDTCQLRVHESCLSSSTTLDENGNFLCPFCAYSYAISKYLEAKKQVSLARKYLQANISLGVEHRPVIPSQKEADLDKKKSTQSEAAGQRVKVNANVHTVSEDNEDCAPNEHDNELSNQHKWKCNEKESPFSNRGSVSSLSRRCRDKKPLYTSPTIPLIRRKKLQWTKSEVEILKEGVQRFSSNDNSKGIPWRDILDFGRDVFHKGRTTIDLKDKWRNISKGSPAKKKQKL